MGDKEKRSEKGLGLDSSSTTWLSIDNAKFEVEKFSGTNNFGI
jgi:hypothetical protein